jgi:hypothetical protein
VESEKHIFFFFFSLLQTFTRICPCTVWQTSQNLREHRTIVSGQHFAINRFQFEKILFFSLEKLGKEISSRNRKPIGHDKVFRGFAQGMRRMMRGDAQQNRLNSLICLRDELHARQGQILLVQTRRPANNQLLQKKKRNEMRKV